MTNQLLREFVIGIYGLACFGLGGTIIFCAFAGPSTVLRNRLMALGAFALILAACQWMRFMDLRTGNFAPPQVELGAAALSFLSLYYFAFGAPGRRRMADVIVLASTSAWCVAALLISEPTLLEVITRIGIGMPAASCAAFMLVYDPAFCPTDVLSQRKKVCPGLLSAATGFAALALLQIFSMPAAFFPASVFNSANFEVVFGVSVVSVRAAVILVIMTAILTLVKHFNAVMRREAEQRATQQQLNLTVSENRLAGILKIALEAIIVTDDKMRIQLFNKGAEVVFGYTEHEIIGQRIDRLMPVRFRVAHNHHVQTFAAAHVQSLGMEERKEIIGLRKNGEEFPAQASISKFGAPNGVIYTTILRDVSAERAARTELLDAKLAAEAANEAKSRFLANMSHELRTPLNAIIGFASLLLNEAGYHVEERKRHEYAEDIQGAGRHLLAIINEVLDISRIEVGKIQLNEEDVILSDLIGSCIRMKRPLAAEVGIEITTDVAAALPAIHADKRLLTQVLLNILSNALKFSERGGRIVVSARVGDGGGVDLSVRDTGIGMSAQDITRIGEPFLQIDSQLARNYEGVGLGLAISKRLVELHGGELRIDSTPGRGTTVTVLLPPRRVRAEPLAAPAHSYSSIA